MCQVKRHAYLEGRTIGDFLPNAPLLALYVVEYAQHEAVPLEAQPADGCVTPPVVRRLHSVPFSRRVASQTQGRHLGA